MKSSDLQPLPEYLTKKIYTDRRKIKNKKYNPCLRPGEFISSSYHLPTPVKDMMVYLKLDMAKILDMVYLKV